MPELGEIKSGRELGKRDKNHKYIWQACIVCGNPRWVRLSKGHAAKLKCQCERKGRRGEKSPGWKGGRYKDGDGYIYIRTYPEDFFYPMAKKHYGYIREHRLVVAKHLGRCLQRWEIVHHRNGVKDDNRIENLQLVTDDRHRQITILENRIKYLETKIEQQDKEIKLLRWQVKNLIRQGDKYVEMPKV